MNFSEAYTIVESAHKGTSFTHRIYASISEAEVALQDYLDWLGERNLYWSLEVVSLESLYEARWEEGYAEGRLDERNGYER